MNRRFAFEFTEFEVPASNSLEAPDLVPFTNIQNSSVNIKMGGAVSSYNVAPTVPASPTLSRKEKLALGLKMLTSSKLEDAIVWFRESRFHSLDFSTYVLSGQWIPLIDLDEVIAIYDPEFALQWESDDATVYRYPKGSGHLLESYIDRHSNHSNSHSLANSIVNMKGKDLHMVLSPVPKAFIPEYDTDTDTVSGQLSPHATKNTASVGSLTDQFLPLLLARLLPLYLKQRNITPSTCSGKESACETTYSPSSQATSPDLPAAFNLHEFTSIEKEQYVYFQSLLLSKEAILGVVLSVSWVAKIQRVVENTSLPLCLCAVTTSSTHTALHPVVYANAAYENLTGHAKSELVNESSGSFWHYDRSESGQILEIQQALRTGVSLKLAVHNVHRDGRAYVNMLALRPVYKAGEYKYMISVQYDLFEGGNGRNSVANDLRRIECLLSFVADTMVM